MQSESTNTTHSRTREIFLLNPTIQPIREEAPETSIYVYDYDALTLQEHKVTEKEACYRYKDTNTVTWINVEGLKKAEVEQICNHYNIHALITEDILSVGQRPKMDDIEGILYCLLNM